MTKGKRGRGERPTGPYRVVDKRLKKVKLNFFNYNKNFIRTSVLTKLLANGQLVKKLALAEVQKRIAKVVRGVEENPVVVKVAKKRKKIFCDYLLFLLSFFVE